MTLSMIIPAVVICRLVAVVAALLSMLATPALGVGGNPQYTFTPKALNTGIQKGEVAIDFNWVKTGDTKVTEKTIKGIMVAINDTPETVAAAVLTALGNDDEIKADWDFTLQGVPAKAPTKYVVKGTPKKGQTPKMKLANAAVVDGQIAMGRSGTVDPQLGIARWGISGTLSATNSGQVGIGIEGQEFATDVLDTNGLPKTVDQIKQELVSLLYSAGFTATFIDPSSGLITLPGITTGDPVGTDGADLGAILFTTDGDLLGSAGIETPVPLLSISPDSTGSSVILQWSCLVNCVLEETLSEDLLGAWTTVTNQPSVDQVGNQSVTLPIESTAKYFRIRYP